LVCADSTERGFDLFPLDPTANALMNEAFDADGEAQPPPIGCAATRVDHSHTVRAAI